MFGVATARDVFEESAHPRGQPDNPGQFAKSSEHVAYHKKMGQYHNSNSKSVEDKHGFAAVSHFEAASAHRKNAPEAKRLSDKAKTATAATEYGVSREPQQSRKKNFIPESDDEITPEVLRNVLSQLPPEARTPAGAERLFNSKIAELNSRGDLTFYHESDGDQVSSMRQKGLVDRDHGIYAAINAPSNFITSPVKTEVQFKVPPRNSRDIVPDESFSWSEKISPHQILLLAHPDLKGAYVNAGDAIPSSQIKSVRLIQGKAHDRMPLAIATDPPVSEKQRRAMFAAKAGHSTLGIPQSVGEEFTSADPGGKLPEHAKAKDMARTKWSALKRLLLEWIDEERAEPEHATDAEKRPKPDVGFEHPAKGTDHCADCTHFEAPDACELVEGRVQPRDWCKMFLASQTRPEAEDEDPRVRAAGIAFVTPEGKTLFLRRSDASDHEGEWCFPGGVIEAGETPEEAAIREASEETGYSAREGAGGMRQAHRHLHDGVEFTTFYQPVAAPFDPNLNDESTEHAWHPIDAAPDPIHPGVRATIDEILANLDDSAENEAEDAVKHDPKTGQFTSSSGTSYSTKPKEKGGGSTVHHESGEIGNTNFIAPNPNYPKDKSGYTAWSSHTKGYVGSPRSTAGASAASRTMGSLLGRKPTINPRLFTSEHHAIKGLIEHHEAHKASAQDTPTTSALPDAARRARLRGRGDLARRIEAEDAEIKRDEHGQFAASQGYNEVAHNQEGQPWTWAKKIGADPSGTTHTVNIKHAGEPKSFIATRLFKPSGTISGGSVLVGKHASFKEAHEASLKAINSLPRMKDAPPFGQDEVKHDPKTGQFTSGEGAAGFGDLHKTYGKGGYLDSHTLEESHPHTVAEFSKAFVSHDPGSYEQHQELNKTKKRLSADPSHSSGAVEDTHKMIAQRLRANHGTPARPAAVQRTAAMSRYLKDKVGGRAKDSGIGPNGHLTVGAQTDPNGGFGWAIGGKVGTGKRQMRMSSAVKSGRGLANVAQDMALATDKRTYDKDGRLHVDRANVTKACVNPYTGAEINAVMKGTDNWKMLDPDRRYALLRHPDELRKAVDTFNGLPILFTHKPASAQDHPHEITVGATGNDASWEPPYVRNSLSIWPAYASEAIDDGSQRQLSMGYAYRAEMTPGVYEGEKYDGVMRDIVGNHLAMVREGRAGADVAIDRALISWRGIAAAIRELRT